MRKSIACVKTIINQKQRTALREHYAGKKYKPLDLRAKQVCAMEILNMLPLKTSWRLALDHAICGIPTSTVKLQLANRVCMCWSSVLVASGSMMLAHG